MTRTMKGFSADTITSLQARGFKVQYTAPPSKDRTVTVQSNGKTETVKIRKAMVHEESEVQQNCVKAFDLIYPKLKLRLYAIPNGGKRDGLEAERLVKEGVRAGVLDLNLDVPRGKYHGMKIEIKTATGRCSPYQFQFINEMRLDYYCCVVRSVEKFLEEVKKYLELKEVLKK